jgi:metal-responsive CopG/Arc/MetJ family transcriptional regulator
MKTAISLPDELFAIAEEFAAQRGMSRSELYATALRAYLAARSREGLVDRINAACEGLDTSLPRDLAAMSRARLRETEW